MSDTKEHILDVAECLFARHGVEAVPLRRIIAEAGLNPAAIHYHFGSKEALVKAVFARRFNPLNRERIALLDETEARAGGNPPAIEEILHAVIAPVFRMGQGTEAAAQFRCLAGRVFAERSGYLEALLDNLFHELELRFDAAFRRAAPELPERERTWRKHMAIGSMAYILRGQDWIRKATGGLCDTSDVEGAIQHLIQFIAAGMKAPAAAGTANAVLDSVESE